MKTYASVRAQISQLEKEAENLRKQEVSKVIAQVREAIAAYGLTAADLGLRGVGKRAAAGKRAGAGVPKYRDPKSGKTWTGHGKPPNWIADAKNRDAFLIDAVAAEPSAASAPAKKAAIKKAPAKPATTGTAKKTRTSLKQAMAKKGASAKKAASKTAAPASEAAAPAAA